MSVCLYGHNCGMVFLNDPLITRTSESVNLFQECSKFVVKSLGHVASILSIPDLTVAFFFDGG